MKRIFICVACVVALLFGIAIAEEVTVIASGECGKDGDNVIWELDSAGMLTISGNGEMKDYIWADSPWYSNRSSLKTAIIQNGVTSVGRSAFYYCSNLTSVNLSSSINIIRSSAFYGCSKLHSINIPRGVSDIGEGAFLDCNNLDNVILQEGLISIGNSAFSYCSSLQSIIIPEGVTSIGQYAFSECCNLTKVTLPDSLTKIDEYTFYGCNSIGSINIPSGVTIIMQSAFDGCSSLRSITIPDSVISIYSHAFYYCRNLSSITIPASVSYIDNSAFDNCYSLKKIMFLGNNMPKLGNWVFFGCPTIYCYEYSEVDFWATNNGYDCVYINGVDLNTPISVALPQNIRLVPGESKEIATALFPQIYGMDIIWESSDPSIVSVENGVLTGYRIGKATITASCNKVYSQTPVTVYVPLESFDLSETELWLVTDDTAQLNICNIQPADATVSLSWRNSDSSVLTLNSSGEITALNTGDATVTAVSYNGIVRTCLVHVYCPVTVIETKKIMLPASIKTIEAEAFTGDGFTYVVIPYGCKSISEGAFLNCAKLQFIEIPTSVETINESAFEGCDDLTIVTVPGSVAERFANEHNIECILYE